MTTNLTNNPINLVEKLSAMTYKEVIDLHEIIESYFTNQLNDAPNQVVDKFFNHFANNFTMVAPDGSSKDLSFLKNWFPSTCGSKPNLKIEIKNYQFIYHDDNITIAEYTEIHKMPENTVARKSTVVLQIVPNNDQLLWLRLHETWCTI